MDLFEELEAASFAEEPGTVAEEVGSTADDAGVAEEAGSTADDAGVAEEAGSTADDAGVAEDAGATADDAGVAEDAGATAEELFGTGCVPLEDSTGEFWEEDDVWIVFFADEERDSITELLMASWLSGISIVDELEFVSGIELSLLSEPSDGSSKFPLEGESSEHALM